MTASIAIYPTVVTQGNVLTVTLAGFFPSENVNITVSQTGSYISVTVNPYGGGTFYFGPINDPAGSYTLVASDGGSNYASTSYTVLAPTSATITILPGTIASGSNITVTAAGFLANHSIRITLDQTGGYITGTTNAQGGGSWTIGPINASPGAYTMTATDGTNTATNGFTISVPVANKTLTLTEVGPGSVSNTPTGTSFASGTIVTLTAIPNQGASFTGWYEGINFLSSSLSYQITMSTDRTINGLFTQPQTAVVSPDPVTQGNKISVAVTGFLPNHVLTLTVVETGGYWIAGPTNGSGAATYTNLGPINDTPGTYHLRVSDGTNTLTVSYAVSAGTTQTFSSLAISNVTKV